MVLERDVGSNLIQLVNINNPYVINDANLSERASSIGYKSGNDMNYILHSKILLASVSLVRTPPREI